MENENPQNNNRLELIEQYLLDPEKTIFEMFSEIRPAIEEIRTALSQIDLNNLEQIVGEDGRTPERGIDYLTDKDLDALEQFIIQNLPVEGVNYPSPTQVNTYIDEQVAKIPRVKGDRGEKGKDGIDGKNGSPDTPKQIIEKIRSLPKNQGFKTKDVRGLDSRLRFVAEFYEEFESLRKAFESLTITLPMNTQGGLGLVVEVHAGQGISIGGTQVNPIVNIDSLAGFITAGTNISITGSGTIASPFVINSTGGGAGTWGSITGTLSDQTDLQNALDAKFNAPTGNTSQYVRGDGSLATFPDVLDTNKLRGVSLDATVGSPTDGKILVYRSAGSDWVLEDKPTSSGNPAWGDITGTLASQTDLQNALDDKQDEISGASLSTATVAGDDKVLIQDTSDGDSLKTVTAQSIADLAGGGGSQDLDDVLTIGNTSGTEIIITDTTETTTVDFDHINLNDGAGSQLQLEATKVGLRQSSNEASIVSDAIDANRVHTLQNKTGTIAHTDDISLATLGITATASELNILDGVTASTTEINYIDGVTSSIQTQLDSKQPRLVYTGSTTTAAGTAAKVVTLDSPYASYTPQAGDMFWITYSGVAQTASNATLNINSSGAVNVRLANANANNVGHTTASGGRLLYLYDGTYYHLIGSQLSANTTYTEISEANIINSGNATTGLITGRRAEYLLSQKAVKLTDNQTVAGVKTFSDFPVTPSSAPTTDYQTANKKYVDDSKAPRTSVTTSASSLTPNFQTAEYFEYTALAAGLTINTPTNFPVGEVMSITVTATGSNRAFTDSTGADWVEDNDPPANFELGFIYEIILSKKTNVLTASWTRAEI